MELNGTEYSLGTYVITTESPLRQNGTDLAELEGYSVLYLLKRTRTEGRLHLAAGTNYVTAILVLLNDAGITDYEADETAYTLAADREDWDEGTPYLTIVNQLLSEIGYSSVWVRLDGTVMLTRYAAPTLSGVTHTYTEGEYSLIESDYKIMIIWQPEKMNTEAANKLLKLLEEPPAGTYFLMVTQTEFH